MSETPPQSSNRSAENVLFVVGGFVGFFIVFQGLIPLLVMMLFGATLSIAKDPSDFAFFALMVGTPPLLAGTVIYVIITKKPKGFTLGLLIGLLIGLGFASLLTSSCAITVLRR